MNRFAVAKPRGRPREVDAVAFEGLSEDSDSEPFLIGLDRALSEGATGGGICKEPFDFCRDFLAVEVSDGYDHEVVGGVPTFKEAPHLGAIEGADVRGRAKDRCTVGMDPEGFLK